MALLCAVLSLGRIEWWRDAAWIGWALAGSIVLVAAGSAYEHFRANPLINTRWLGSGLMLRLGIADRSCSAWRCRSRASARWASCRRWA